MNDVNNKNRAWNEGYEQGKKSGCGKKAGEATVLGGLAIVTVGFTLKVIKEVLRIKGAKV